MSRLNLPSPVAAAPIQRYRIYDGEPVTIPFPPHDRFRRQHLDVLERARLLYENRRCPHCRHPEVEPLELNDGLRSRGNRLTIPGTATLVGFRCLGCEAEWPV